MRDADIVDRLKAASEPSNGIPPAEAQALFLEAADLIELLRSLLEPVEEAGLADMRPQGEC